eukprot:gene21847-28877_t
MFKNILRDHEAKSRQLKKRQDSEHAAALACIPSICNSAVNFLNTDVQKIYETQKDIEREATAVKSELGRFQKNVLALSGLIRKVDEALKDVGDFENYVSFVEEQVDGVVGRLETLLLPKLESEESTEGRREERREGSACPQEGEDGNKEGGQVAEPKTAVELEHPLQTN